MQIVPSITHPPPPIIVVPKDILFFVASIVDSPDLSHEISPMQWLIVNMRKPCPITTLPNATQGVVQYKCKEKK